LARGLGTFLSNLSDEFFCVMDGTYFVCSLFFTRRGPPAKGGGASRRLARWCIRPN
jgi:hypothetical protein